LVKLVERIASGPEVVSPTLFQSQDEPKNYQKEQMNRKSFSRSQETPTHLSSLMFRFYIGGFNEGTSLAHDCGAPAMGICGRTPTFLCEPIWK
jgi:hypothetical protein